jgi:hypothetical protein
MAKFNLADRWNSGLPGYYWLTRPKAMVITHHGIAKRDELGRESVLELNPGGTNFTNFPGFSDGNRVSVKDWKPLSEGFEIEARVQEICSRDWRYSLCFWNCEHLANEVWSGTRHSQQAGLGFILGTLVLLFAASAGIKR